MSIWQTLIPKIAVRSTDRIAYLTDNTKVEKQAVIVSLCEGAKLSIFRQVIATCMIIYKIFCLMIKDLRITFPCIKNAN